MSYLSCFSSPRSDSPPRVVEEGETRCAFLEENVSEGIMDLVGESSGSDKQIVSIAVPFKGHTAVLYRQITPSEIVDEAKETRVGIPVKDELPSPEQMWKLLENIESDRAFVGPYDFRCVLRGSPRPTISLFDLFNPGTDRFESYLPQGCRCSLEISMVHSSALDD
ncbi:MAG: hypothetical protein OXF02_05650 [Simkaniaceae bacterium]|nr:hypothetical protein [Simkaniaceae bacterium]